MQPIVTAAEMRALDRATSEDIGLAAFTLMETAGRAVAEAAFGMLERRDARVAVVCGPGNNGGDGVVAARVLRDRGVEATAYLVAERAAIKGDALAHLEILERAGGVVRGLQTAQQLVELGGLIAQADLVIDALFGIGVSRAIEGHLADVIDVMNRAPQRLAVDIPSGLVADTGAAPGAVVEATRTVTMGALKIALVSAPGFARCGEVEVAEIGIPTVLLKTANVRAGLIAERDVRGWLPKPHALDHKGTRGHVLVVGGAPGMRGAGRLASMAALRAGAGLSTLAAEPGDDLGAPDSVMTKAVSGPIASALAKMNAVVIGPGLGAGTLARGWLDEVLASGVPAVLDADALNMIAADPRVLNAAKGPVVLTPHPGEAARLLTSTVPEVEADRLASARALAAKTRAVVVLKGARTVICDGTLGDDYCALNPTGGPALATGGSGDVLAGTIGALLAQGLAPGDAACAGAFIHGLAGERLEAVHGRGAVSSDLPLAIATVLAQLSG
ncbi:MAG: NAD(P)H-hydrate dehydratase [Kofleriaceae bacterium]|nr:NAD(P)H-hydrate dehydratase [Kofleriaceae bacterium]